METSAQRAAVLQRVLQADAGLPRSAVRLLKAVAGDSELLERMRFCCPADRRHLRDSILASAAEGGCYAVMVGTESPRGDRGKGDRARLILQGLDLALTDLLAHLKALPVWFLAVDEAVVQIPRGEAVRVQETVYRLATLQGRLLRRAALEDQLDAALEARDFAACARLSAALDG